MCRYTQMILEAILPAYLKHLQTSAGRKDPRTERDILHQLGVAMKTLVTNAEALTKYQIKFEMTRSLLHFFKMNFVWRHYTGPQKTFEKSPSQKPPPKAVLSTTIEIDEDSHSRFLGDHFRSSTIPERTQSNDSEVFSWLRLLVAVVIIFFKKTCHVNRCNGKSSGCLEWLFCL